VPSVWLSDSYSADTKKVELTFFSLGNALHLPQVKKDTKFIPFCSWRAQLYL